MSNFTGKCDLYDHMMLEKTYPLYPDNEYSPLTSDELECFRIFRERTQGKLYQHFKLKLTPYNIDKEIELCNNPRILSKIEHKEYKADKRYKDGKKLYVWYTYIYWDKEYKSLDELNKKHYYAIRVIRFNTIFDLIPYYPYIVASCGSDANGETIFLAKQSYVDDLEMRHREYGSDTDYCYSYRKELQKHYYEILEKYGHLDDVCGKEE